MMVRRSALVLVSGISLALVACRERPWHGIVLDPASAAPPISIAGAPADPSTRVELAADKGSVVLLYFGYTHCPDVCPTVLATWARAKRALGADSAGVRFIFVSVDPQRDTPELSAAYARQFDKAFVGTSPTEVELCR